MTQAHVIGLLGGMSWPSTISYYRGLNEGAGRALGGSHSARLLVWSDDYAEVERLQLAERWDDAGDLLASGATRLVAAGAEMLGIACNTMHRVADAVREIAQLPLVDIVEETTAALGAKGVQSAAVLGTGFTLEAGMYQAALDSARIAVIEPARDDAQLVDRIIYEELCLGSVQASSVAVLAGVAQRVVAAGADAVVLACTELGEAMQGLEVNAEVIDTTQVHVRALLARSLDLAREVPAGG